MSSSHSAQEMRSYKVIGPFGGEGEKYKHFGIINGICAEYNPQRIVRIDFQVQPHTSTEVQQGRTTDGWNLYEVGLNPNECITHLLGYSKEVIIKNKGIIAITSLTFITSRNRKLGPIGTESGEPFTLQPVAGKIIEFLVGLTGDNIITSIGARVELTSQDSRSVEKISVKPIGPFGGGRPWNDGTFAGVKEIHLRVSSDDVIRRIDFVYDFGGKEDIVVMHPGVLPTNCTVDKVVQVRLDYSNEYLTSISGRMRDDGSISTLEFYTNFRVHRTSNSKEGSYFWYPSTGANKIVGFHGAWGVTLNAIGVYAEPIVDPPLPVRCEPMRESSGGLEWNDGGYYSHVIGYRVTISEKPRKIESITFRYDLNGSFVEGDRHGGVDPKNPGEWTMLNFPEERLDYLTGYCHKETPGGPTTIHNLRLTTTSTTRPTRDYAVKFPRRELEEYDELKNRKKENRKHDQRRLETLTENFNGSFSFRIPEEDNGRRISGFFGRAGECLNSIGAYVGSY